MAFVTWEKKEGAAVVTINRPEAMNALNETVLKELEAAVEGAAGDPEVLVLIFTGTGKAFVAGADIAGMQPLDQAGGMAWGQLGQAVFRRIETLEKPTIAAVNGFALGGGCELAMACDMRIAG
ncbi:MAG: enoyl-CoA hydratase-related protein, partial [Bacillota bacterium]|nr:enoyl-CoA hydratase-related protein [Bacillota bacterium]